MNKLLTFLILSFAFQAGAQMNIDGLIGAERSFAAHSVTHNTRDAFLRFLDSAGIVFEKGRPVNGIETWNKKERRPGILNWYPQFAEIAASNDFGYTTGPWIFQPGAVTDSVVARGQYITVWHADNGNWKFLVDLGVGNLPPSDSLEVQKIAAGKIATNPADLSSMVKTEEAFIKGFEKDKTKAYLRFLSSQSILNRNSRLPAITASEQAALIEATPQTIDFEVGGSGMAKSGDLGFVYGTMIWKDKTENYLRIWRREKEGWKIALEVLRY